MNIITLLVDAMILTLLIDISIKCNRLYLNSKSVQYPVNKELIKRGNE